MQPISLQLLSKNQNTLKILYNKEGQVVFVGTLRQMRRRIKKLLGDGPLPWMLHELEERGFTMEDAISKNPGSGYTIYMSDLKEKIKDIPQKPGVYQFKNKDSEIIYVGKAKNLKSRVSQYFGNHDNRPQLPFLMAEATDVTYTVVDNELESLYLENTLIKKYLPKYNIQLRDDKNYAFITVDYRTQIPQIGYARKFEPSQGSKIKDQGSTVRYFGPYSAVYKIRNTLHLIRRIFPYCANKEVGTRPCFYYYLHRCPGVCIGKISLEEYNLQLDRICWFLSGNTSKITQELRNEMKLAAADQRFESAARLRDQLTALELLEERQNVIMPKPVSWDVLSMATSEVYACVNLFKIREGKMQDKENFVIELSELNLHTQESHESAIPSLTESGRAEVLQSFMEQYYLETSNAPKTIYTQAALEDPELVTHILQSRFDRKTEICMPHKGKAKDLVTLGITNAEEYLKNWLVTQAGHLDKVHASLGELKELLHLDKVPERIECYDISNIQGTNAVGSMVVLKNGLPAKSEYRKFKIQTKQTPDDFAMMKEMLTRRLARLTPAGNSKSEITNPNTASLPETSHLQPNTSPIPTAWPRPDLIVIDGGKGQLGVAVEVLKEKGLDIPVVGLAKRIEEIFFPNNPVPLVLPHSHASLQLLQRLRDEAHRFGITFHRALRSKQAVKSALDNIPGIGPKTKKLLKQKFGTVAEIRKTSFEDLAAVVGERIAQTIQQTL